MQSHVNTPNPAAAETTTPIAPRTALDHSKTGAAIICDKTSNRIANNMTLSPSPSQPLREDAAPA
jgi:hypothetical protein